MSYIPIQACIFTSVSDSLRKDGDKVLTCKCYCYCCIVFEHDKFDKQILGPPCPFHSCNVNVCEDKRVAFNVPANIHTYRDCGSKKVTGRITGPSVCVCCDACE